MFSPTERGIVLSIYIGKMACTDSCIKYFKEVHNYTLLFLFFEVHFNKTEMHFNYFTAPSSSDHGPGSRVALCSGR